jgi:hypothetical protein
LLVQPVSSIAGDAIALRSAPPPPDSPDTLPLSEASVTAAGMARETSRIDCSQSKREAARSRTVWMRALASVSKSA